jgi:hypothetical protein
MPTMEKTSDFGFEEIENEATNDPSTNCNSGIQRKSPWTPIAANLIRGDGAAALDVGEEEKRGMPNAEEKTSCWVIFLVESVKRAPLVNLIWFMFVEGTEPNTDALLNSFNTCALVAALA